MPQNDPATLGIIKSEVITQKLTSGSFAVNPTDVNFWNYQTKITIPTNFTSILFVVYGIDLPSPQPQALRFGIITEFEPNHFTFMHSATLSFPFGPFSNTVCIGGYGPVFTDDNFIPDITNLTGLGINAPVQGQANPSYYRNLPLMFPFLATVVAKGISGIKPVIDVNLRWVYLR